MPTTRLHLTPSQDNRNASNVKDSIGFNCLYETQNDKKWVVKRPGTYTLPVSPALPTGEGQGLYHWNGYLIAGQTGGLYGINGGVSTAFGSIAGTAVPWSFAQTSNDQYLCIHNGSNLYLLNKTGNVFSTGVVNSIVGSVNINYGGSGYVATPSVTFGPPPSGTTALGTAVISNGRVTSVTILNPGTGYTAAPTVTIGPPTQVAVQATATISDATVGGVAYYCGRTGQNSVVNLGSISLTNGGDNYLTTPTFKVYYNGVGSVAATCFYPALGSVEVASGYCTVVDRKITSLVITSTTTRYAMSTNGIFIRDGYAYPITGTVVIDPPSTTSNSNATGTAVMTSGSPSILGPYAFGMPYLNQRIYLMNKNGTIFQSGLDNPTSWNSAEYIYANSDPDEGVALVRHLNYLVAFGKWSTQFFYDSGNPVGSVLTNYQAAKLEIGCAEGLSVATAEQTLVWIGQGLTEGRSVYILDGTSPIKVSNIYIDRILNTSTLEGTHSYCMKVAGHTLYVLSLATADLTFVYDIEEKTWYRWTSNVSGVEKAFQYMYFNGNVEYSPNLYVQHEYNGQVYILSPDYYGDGTTPIDFRIRTTKEDQGSTKRKFYRRVEVVGDKTPATLSIRHTDDDYQTWSTARTVSLLDTRPVLYQNGSARRRAWEVFSADLQPIRIESLEIDIDISE